MVALPSTHKVAVIFAFLGIVLFSIGFFWNAGTGTTPVYESMELNQGPSNILFNIIENPFASAGLVFLILAGILYLYGRSS